MEYLIDAHLIQRFGKEFANLDDAEIEAIVDVGKVLHYFVESNDTDGFIDIIIPGSSTALVVAEVFRKESVYKNSFLGHTIFKKDEPAVFQAFELNACVQNAVGISYDPLTGNQILARQTTLPIRYGSKVVAVLILEKALDYEFTKAIANPSASKNATEVVLSILGLKDGMEHQIREGILVFDDIGGLVYYNPTAKRIYEEIGYYLFDNIHFDNLNLSSLRFGQLLAQDRQAKSDLSNLVINESVSINKKSYDIRIFITEHANAKLVMLIDDYISMQSYETEIKNHLVSYREIHHRVKNNLQTIASLLRLQSYHCTDEYTASALSDSINRILSIAITHDLLARRSGDQISIMEILQQLCQNLENARTNGPNHVKLLISGEDFMLDSQKSNVVALVVNELIQNSLKHAFPGQMDGKVKIIISGEGDIKVIEVTDDGIGYDSTLTKQDSLGLTIVRSYVEEILEGKLVISTGTVGTSTSFAFKL